MLVAAGGGWLGDPSGGGKNAANGGWKRGEWREEKRRMEGRKGANRVFCRFKSRRERQRNCGVLAANREKKFFGEVISGARIAVRKAGDFYI